MLFDTDAFNDYIEEEAGLKEVKPPPYNEHGVYSPEIHAEILGIDPERIYNPIEDLERFLSDEAPLLENTDHEIVLVSRGQKKFQEKKIEASGVEEFVDKVIVVEKGSKDVADIEFLVDDRKIEIERAELPGFEFDMKKHSIEEALEEAERHGA